MVAGHSRQFTPGGLPDNCETHCIFGNLTHDHPIVSPTRYQLCHRDHRWHNWHKRIIIQTWNTKRQCNRQAGGQTKLLWQYRASLSFARRHAIKKFAWSPFFLAKAGMLDFFWVFRQMAPQGNFVLRASKFIRVSQARRIWLDLSVHKSAIKQRNVLAA